MVHFKKTVVLNNGFFPKKKPVKGLLKRKH